MIQRINDFSASFYLIPQLSSIPIHLYLNREVAKRDDDGSFSTEWVKKGFDDMISIRLGDLTFSNIKCSLILFSHQEVFELIFLFSS